MRLDEVDQVLEEARVGASIGRRIDDQDIGINDLLQDMLSLVIELLAPQGRAERWLESIMSYTALSNA